MPTPTQSIREIVAAHSSAACVLQRFEIDLCTQADESLDHACSELQLSVEQVLEKLTESEAELPGATPLNPASLSLSRLIRHIVRVHHRCIRQELPRLSIMAHKLAELRSDRATELIDIEASLGRLRAELFTHIQREEQVLFPFIAHMDQDSVVVYPTSHACFQSVSHPIAKMVQDHDTADIALADIRRLTHDYEPPEWACATHIALYAGLRAFESDFKQHVHLENDVLFPRAIAMESALNQRR